MRTTRPSGKAVVVAGVIALTLVVGASSGAVAGKLITSKNIKDGTIKTQDLKDDSVTNDKLAPGSVDWEKSIDDATKEMIASLAQSGPAGPAGPAGPTGPRGATGAAGADGMGEVVFWDYFGFEEPDLEEVPETGYELPPLNGESIVLDEPGDYLLNMDGVVLALDPDAFGAAIVAGEPNTDESFVFDACLATGVAVMEIPLATCETSMPISVQAGETLELPITVMPAVFGGCESESCAPSLAAARVVVYRINSTPTADPVVPGPCRTDLGKGLQKLAAQRC